MKNYSVLLMILTCAFVLTQTAIVTQAQQQTCTPTTTVTEGDLFPGGIVSFGVSSGSGSVTVDHVNAGTGLQSLTLVGVPINAIVNIPAFAPGTFDPVVVTFVAIDPALPVDFTLRVASTFHAANIRVRCGVVTPTPTPMMLPLSADISVFRPSDPVRYLLRYALGFSTAQFGLSSDRIIPADYNSDGRADIAVFRDRGWA